MLLDQIVRLAEQASQRAFADRLPHQRQHRGGRHLDGDEYQECIEREQGDARVPWQKPPREQGQGGHRDGCDAKQRSPGRIQSREDE